MNTLRKILCLILILAGFTPVKIYSQGRFIDPREAEQYYNVKNYKEAINIYKKLLLQHPDNINYHFKLGLCYLNTHADKKMAVPYFEWITEQPKTPNESWYELGVAYHYASRFDDAIKAFKHYEQLVRADDRTKAEKQIAECKTAKELIKHPLNVTLTNVGHNINSTYPDYYPLISGDGTTLIFTTRRPCVNHCMYSEIDGYYQSDVYISHLVKGQWQKAASVGELINSRNDEEAVGLNPDATKLVIYMDNIKEDGKIVYSERRGNNYERPQSFPESINDGFQSSGVLSASGNVLFFSSRRPGGYGGTDIYIMRKIPGNIWALPENLGNNINTAYNEDFPWYDNDSATLYFSSQGHNTMGDYDLFKSSWITPEGNTWSPARNLGYPINTTYDDRCISFTKDHHYAYVSQVRPDSLGDLDIYRVTFNNMEAFTIVTGHIKNPGRAKEVDATITTTNTQTKEQLFFKPVKNSGHYVMALLPGTYDIQIDAKGYQSIFDRMIVDNNTTTQTEVTRNYILVPSLNKLTTETSRIYFRSH